MRGFITVLLPPVSEVVHGDGVKAIGGMDIGNEVADDGGAKMPGVEGLGDVGAAELNDDLLALAGLVAAVGIPLLKHAAQEDVALQDLADAQIQERASISGSDDEFVQLDLRVRGVLLGLYLL